MAFSKSPSASVRACLQSIIPAPVKSLNFLTSVAEIDTLILYYVWFGKSNRFLKIKQPLLRFQSSPYYVLQDPPKWHPPYNW